MNKGIWSDPIIASLADNNDACCNNKLDWKHVCRQTKRMRGGCDKGTMRKAKRPVVSGGQLPRSGDRDHWSAGQGCGVRWARAEQRRQREVQRSYASKELGGAG